MLKFGFGSVHGSTSQWLHARLHDRLGLRILGSPSQSPQTATRNSELLHSTTSKRNGEIATPRAVDLDVVFIAADSAQAAHGCLCHCSGCAGCRSQFASAASR